MFDEQVRTGRLGVTLRNARSAGPLAGKRKADLRVPDNCDGLVYCDVKLSQHV